MTSIMPARGCVYSISPENSGTVGFYSMDPAIENSKESPVLILGASLSDEDIVQPKSTLDNMKILYTFGQGFGQVQIHGVALLGNSDNGAGASFAAVVAYFQRWRSSTAKNSIQLSLPGKVAYNIYLTGLAVGNTDPNFNIQQFMLGGLQVGQPNQS